MSIEMLLALEEIKALRAKYCRYLDTKDWTGYRSIFSPDVEFDGREAMQSFGVSDENLLKQAFIIGVDNVIKFVSASIQGIETVHQCHTPEIEFTSSTTAAGIWAFEDKLWVPDNSQTFVLHKPEGSRVKLMHGYGHYVETYQKSEEQWLIKTLRVTRLKVEFL